ncbi:MAG: hypothetical protein ABR585_15980, partial [Gemmatimonadaceae bacterium]
KRTVRAQKFDVLSSIVDGDLIALEIFWSGLLAVPVDTLPADSEMRAHVSMWLEFRDGKICEVRAYHHSNAKNRSGNLLGFDHSGRGYTTL